MCEEAVQEHPWLLHNVPIRFRTQEMYEKAVGNYYPLDLFLIILRQKKCAKKLLKWRGRHCDMYRISIKQKKYVTRP